MAIELLTFKTKYDEQIIAMRVSGGSNIRLFDAVKLFAENDTLAEARRVADEAEVFAISFVNQMNAARIPTDKEGV